MALAISFYLGDYLSNALMDALTDSFALISAVLSMNEYLFMTLIYVILILLMIPITVIHELIHGLTYRIFGGNVYYGFKGIYAYTQEISNKIFDKTQFECILLAPLLVITCICLLFQHWLTDIICFLNIIGSTGDLLMFFFIVFESDNYKIKDTSVGFDVISMEGESI